MVTVFHLNIHSLFMIFLPFNLTAATKVQLSDGTSGCSVQSLVKGKGIGKGKIYPRTGHEGPEGEKRYSSSHSLTLALDGGGWSTPRPGCFTPGKDPVPIA
jgi:hypothetical protein